jgi:hypothetical protein
MISRMLDPWFLLELIEMLCKMLIGIVLLGIAAECVCLLLLWLGERLHRHKGSPAR